MMFSTKTKVIFTTLLSSLLLSSGAYACSLDGWSSSSGAVDVGQPFGASLPDVDGVARFEEFCALQVSDTGHVQTDAPSHSRVRGRAYIFPDTFSGSNDSNVLVAYSAEDGTGELFSVAWNNGNWVVSATGGGSDSTAATGGYDLIEFDYDPGSGNLHVWVNADATTDAPTFTVASGPSATVESIRVGLPDGFNGNTGNFLFVDSVEMHNETAIGPLFNCDAAPNGDIDISDIVAAIDEFTEAGLSAGTPNCDPTNGYINISDIVATIDAFTAS